MAQPKIAYISLWVTIVTMTLSIIAVLGISTIAVYMADKDIQNHKYTIAKSDQQLIITSQSPWLNSMPYEIIIHTNETYYLKNDKGLKEIKDSELK